MRLVAAVAVLALSASVACSDGDDAAPDESTTTAAPSTTTAPTETDGCGGSEPTVDETRLVHATLESSGGAREYMVYVPEAYDPEVPAAIAYVFHGAGSNKEEQFRYSGYAPYADEDGALLVLPDALGTPKRWSPLGGAFAGVEGVDDLQFFDDLSLEVMASFCVDPARVLVTGMSSGGFMSASVGCTHADELAAVGPVTATVWAEPLCGDAAPVAYAYFHGTDDPIVLYDGGGDRRTQPVPQTSQAWADQNGCEGEPIDERIGEEVVHRTWDECDASTDLYTVEGGGHTWPGASGVGRLGHTTDDIDATEIIWDVFRAAWPSAR